MTTRPETELAMALVTLRDCRARAQRVADDLRERRAEFEAEIAEHIEYARASAAQVAEVENEVRRLALVAFDGENRRPAAGVEIKKFKTIKYDEKVALRWAGVHGLFLKLDVPAFEKFVKQGTMSSLDGIVTLGSEDRAQIATDLDAALGEKP